MMTVRRVVGSLYYSMRCPLTHCLSKLNLTLSLHCVDLFFAEGADIDIDLDQEDSDQDEESEDEQQAEGDSDDDGTLCKRLIVSLGFCSNLILSYLLHLR